MDLALVLEDEDRINLDHAIAMVRRLKARQLKLYNTKHRRNRRVDEHSGSSLSPQAERLLMTIYKLQVELDTLKDLEYELGY